MLKKSQGKERKKRKSESYEGRGIGRGHSSPFCLVGYQKRAEESKGKGES